MSGISLAIKIRSIQLELELIELQKQDSGKLLEEIRPFTASIT